MYFKALEITDSMKAVDFPQVTHRIAEDQPEYETLPAYIGQIGEQPHEVGIVSCFELSDEEIGRIKKYKKIWFRGLTFGKPLQPFNIFAVRDYFNFSEERVVNDDLVFNDTQKIEIKFGFWQRLWFLFRGREYVHIHYTVNEYEVKLKQKLYEDK